MKKGACLLLVLVLFVSSLTGCGKTAEPKKDTLTVVGALRSENFDPTGLAALIDPYTITALFDRLFKFGNNAEVVPSLVESYELKEDNVTYVFHLRKNVKFHDGTDFTADDVIFNFDIYTNHPVLSYSFANSVTSYEKIDAYTVNVTVPAPYVDLPGFLANRIAIVPKSAYSSDAEGFAKNPVGTGAYKYVTQDSDGTVRLEANPDYFLGAPEIKNLVIKPPMESSTALVALETGEVDLIFSVPTSLIPVIDKNDKITRITKPSYSSMAFYIFDDGLQGDQNLRKAIFHGINRVGLIDIATDGLAQESKNIMSTYAMGKYAGVTDYKGYDAELAKEYLAKSNYVAGTEILISCKSEDAQVAQLIQADLVALGINMKIEQLDPNTWSSKLSKGELQINLSVFGSYGFTPTTLLPYFVSNSPMYGSHMAVTPEYEAVINEFLNEKDPEKLDSLIEEALKMQYDLVNIFSLYDRVSTVAHTKQITNISDSSAIVNACYFNEIKLAD